MQLFHNNNELLQKLPNHKPREKVLGIESNYNMDKQTNGCSKLEWDIAALQFLSANSPIVATLLMSMLSCIYHELRKIKPAVSTAVLPVHVFALWTQLLVCLPISLQN